MDKRIATPRQETPRLKMPVGSVGIAGEQTGIYPMESPGGWQLYIWLFGLVDDSLYNYCT